MNICLLPTSSCSFGRGAVAAWAGKRCHAACIPPTAKTAFPFPAALSSKISPAPSNNALVLRSVWAPAWPLAGDGSRWQSGVSSGRGGRGGAGGGRRRTLLQSERRVLERQRKDGSISAENLALLTATLDREKEERPTSPPPTATLLAARHMGRPEKRVLQARRSRGEISAEDLARLVAAEDAGPPVGVVHEHSLLAAQRRGRMAEERWWEEKAEVSSLGGHIGEDEGRVEGRSMGVDQGRAEEDEMENGPPADLPGRSTFGRRKIVALESRDLD